MSAPNLGKQHTCLALGNVCVGGEMVSCTVEKILCIVPLKIMCQCSSEGLIGDCTAIKGGFCCWFCCVFFFLFWKVLQILIYPVRQQSLLSKSSFLQSFSAFQAVTAH